MRAILAYIQVFFPSILLRTGINISVYDLIIKHNFTQKNSTFEIQSEMTQFMEELRDFLVLERSTREPILKTTEYPQNLLVRSLGLSKYFAKGVKTSRFCRSVKK